MSEQEQREMDALRQELQDARQVITTIYQNLKDNRYVEGDITLKTILIYVGGFLIAYPEKPSDEGPSHPAR